MSYQVRLKQVPSQQVAAVHVSTTFERVGEEIQRAFATLGERAGAPTDMPFLVTLSIDEERGEGEFELCWPCDEEIEGGGVFTVEVPGGTMASTVHRGPYAEIGPAYAWLDEWIAEHGYRHAGPPREVYLNDPGDVGEAGAETEVLMPLG
jgi:DNA gyrase inhibitor GyrI